MSKEINASPILRDRLNEALETFLELVSVKTLNRSLRDFLLCYVSDKLDDGIEIDFKDRIKEIGILFEFLDCIEDEYKVV